MTRREWRISAAGRLKGTDAPALAAGLMLCSVLGVDRVSLAAHSEEALSPDEEARLDVLLARRLAGEPVAYLTGAREFYGRDFEVGPAVLVPRPDTELLIDTALELFGSRSSVRFLDLGTGSGCIALTLAAERPGWTGVAVDISPDALDVASRNARRLGVGDGVEMLCADFRGSLPLGAGSFDLVVSNPPYISEKEHAALDPGVRDFEPALALVSGPEGLDHPRAVEQAARRMLAPGGVLLMEHGWMQGPSCRNMCSGAWWRDVRTLRDLAGRDRCLAAVRR